MLVIEQLCEHFKAVGTEGFSGLQYIQKHSESTYTHNHNKHIHTHAFRPTLLLLPKKGIEAIHN